MAIMDLYMIYQFVKRLVTPFNQMPAYKLGIIDANGKFLKKASELKTQEERNAVGYFDVLVINLKRLLAMVPGGKSTIASYAAAILLTRMHESKIDLDQALIHLNENFMSTLKEVEQLQEDGVAINATGPSVYGTAPGEVVVTPAAAKKYKNKNKKQADIVRRVVGAIKMESTLEYHDQLNPKLWDGMILKPEVALKLFEIAEEWRTFAHIPSSSVLGIIITGGNVNFNYTSMSDIDLHLIINRDEFSSDRSLTDDYLQSKKILWTLTHPDISIYGYPVELYAQDVSEQPHFGQGVYSLTHGDWLQAPQHLDIDFASDTHLSNKVQYYKNLIDHMIETKASPESLDIIKKKIQNMRGDSISKNGEFAFGNLVFKELRNLGYLDKIDNYEKSIKDKALSLEALNVEFSKISS